MPGERLRSCWKPILALHAISFVLPVGGLSVPGMLVFVSSLTIGFYLPVLLMVWAANPFFWLGLSALKAGRDGQAASFGLAALMTALPSCLFVARGYEKGLESGGIFVFFLFSGHLAWMASMGSLALVGELAWWNGRDVRPLQYRLGWLMAAIALIAVVIATLPWFAKFLTWTPFTSGGLGVG